MCVGVVGVVGLRNHLHERLFEVVEGDDGASLLLRQPSTRVGNVLADGELARALAHLRDVGAREAVGTLGELVDVDIVGEGGLAGARLRRDGHARGEMV